MAPGFHNKICAICTAVLLLIAVLPGCGGPDRATVSGKISYGQAPIANGEIRFIPLEGEKAAPIGASIKDGEYSVTARGGLAAGDYRVEIYSFQIGGSASRRNDEQDSKQLLSSGPGRQQLLPAKYNARSELRFTREPGQGSVTKDFELTK